MLVGPSLTLQHPVETAPCEVRQAPVPNPPRWAFLAPPWKVRTRHPKSPQTDAPSLAGPGWTCHIQTLGRAYAEKPLVHACGP